LDYKNPASPRSRSNDRPEVQTIVDKSRETVIIPRVTCYQPEGERMTIKREFLETLQGRVTDARDTGDYQEAEEYAALALHIQQGGDITTEEVERRIEAIDGRRLARIGFTPREQAREAAAEIAPIPLGQRLSLGERGDALCSRLERLRAEGRVS
jgi:hypothetical protein